MNYEPTPNLLEVIASTKRTKASEVIDSGLPLVIEIAGMHYALI